MATSQKQDYYVALGVDKKATLDEIKRAHKRLAHKYHPDRNPNNPEAAKKFKEIQEAYDILKDPKKRVQYDQLGHAGFESGGGFDAFTGGFASFGNLFNQGTIFDMFQNFMGPSAAQPEEDLDIAIAISLEQALAGVSDYSFRLRLNTLCKACAGKGSSRPNAEFVRCAPCGGTGQVFNQIGGAFQIQGPCARCKGTGKTIKDSCTHCSGNGVTPETRTLHISLPPGMTEGQIILLRGKGADRGMGRAPGDLRVHVEKINPHPIFQRLNERGDLLIEIPISLEQALLGSVLEVPLLEGGFYSLTLPEGMPSLHSMPIRQKGLPRSLRSAVRGDLICRLVTELPSDLTALQKEKLSEFFNTLNEKPLSNRYPAQKKFTDKLRNYFTNKGY